MIEIALCLAIIGFALVAIIGVLPTGLSVQKENREETIINYEANFLMDAIRNGSQGQDDLTNYVLVITNRVYEYAVTASGTNPIGNPTLSYYTRSNYYYNGSHQFPFLTNGASIIGVLSTPKYFWLDGNHFLSNAITADFRAISGPATDQGSDPSSVDFAFKYRVTVEIVPYGDNFTGFDPSWTNYLAVAQTSPEYSWRQNNFFMFASLHPNFNLIRLTFRWPILPNGKTGTGKQVFRAAGGCLASMPLPFGRAPAPPGYFMQSRSYTNNPGQAW